MMMIIAQKKKSIVKENQKHALKVCDALKCSKFGGFHVAYLKCNVFCLADVTAHLPPDVRSFASSSKLTLFIYFAKMAYFLSARSKTSRSELWVGKPLGANFKRTCNGCK